jgi:hypothetical protein
MSSACLVHAESQDRSRSTKSFKMLIGTDAFGNRRLTFWLFTARRVLKQARIARDRVAIVERRDHKSLTSRSIQPRLPCGGRSVMTGSLSSHCAS